MIERPELLNVVNSHYQDWCKYNPNGIRRLFFIALQGSQNYGLDIETSDVDTKIAVVPTFREMCLEKPLSGTIIRDNNEHIETKDVRLMFEMFKKNNPSYLELLYTEYYLYSPLFGPEWEKLVHYREEFINDVSLAQAIYGTCVEKRKRLTQVTPTTKEAINKFGYDPKSLIHIIRLGYLLINYKISGRLCFSTMLPQQEVDAKLKNTLKDFRRTGRFDGAFKSKEEVEELADDWLKIIKDIADEIIAHPQRQCNTTLLKEILMSVMTKAAEMEIKYGD